MSRIDDIFREVRSRGGRALMPFICGSSPRPGDTARLLPALERAGASVVEVGFPFSDPIADGPVIAAAMHEALGLGATPAGVLAEIASVRAGLKVGVIAMVSVSIVQRVGAKALVAQAKTAGVDGFIFPDLPLDEAGALLALVREAGLTSSLLIAPSTTPQRAEQIVRACTGFVYLLARAGITGESSAAPDIGPRVRMLRGMTDLPIACGFGISTSEHVRQVVSAGLGNADAAIVGSALVRRMSEAMAQKADPIGAAEGFVRDLAGGL